MQGGHLWLQACGFAAMRQGFLGLALIQEQQPQVGMSAGEFRLQLDGTAEMLRGAVAIVEFA
jgi:hypothetical protein